MHKFYILPFWAKYAGEMLKLSEIKISDLFKAFLKYSGCVACWFIKGEAKEKFTVKSQVLVLQLFFPCCF